MEYLLINKQLLKRYGIEKGIFISVLAEIKRHSPNSKITIEALKENAFPFWGKKHISDIIHSLVSDNILDCPSTGFINVIGSDVITTCSLPSKEGGKQIELEIKTSLQEKPAKKVNPIQEAFNELWDSYPEEKRGNYPASYKLFMRLDEDNRKRAVDNAKEYLEQTDNMFISGLLNYIFKGKYDEVSSKKSFKAETKTLDELKDFMLERKKELNK